MRVLIVEDHQIVAEALTAALACTDDLSIIGTANSVADALSMARMERPDVVLMDYRLPDGNGVAAAEAIRAERPETKIVIITAYEDDAMVLRAIEAGLSGFVSKSQNVKALVSALRAAGAGEAVIPPDMLRRLLPRLSPTYRGIGRDLTPRELEVLALVAEGLPNKGIASRLGIELTTARNHVQSILNKLGAHSKLEAVAIAHREGVIGRP